MCWKLQTQSSHRIPGPNDVALGLTEMHLKSQKSMFNNPKLSADVKLMLYKVR